MKPWLIFEMVPMTEPWSVDAHHSDLVWRPPASTSLKISDSSNSQKVAKSPTVKKVAKSPTVKSGRKRSSNFLFHSHFQATWYRVPVGSSRLKNLLVRRQRLAKTIWAQKSQDLCHSFQRHATAVGKIDFVDSICNLGFIKSLRGPYNRSSNPFIYARMWLANQLKLWTFHYDWDAVDNIRDVG